MSDIDEAGDYEYSGSDLDEILDDDVALAPEEGSDASSVDDSDQDDDDDDLVDEVVAAERAARDREILDEVEEDEVVDDEIKDEKPKLAVKTYPSLFSGILSNYEKTAIIGFRAQQIASGGDIYVSTYSDDTPFKIAERELREGKIPYYIDRRLPDGQYISVSLDRLLDVY